MKRIALALVTLAALAGFAAACNPAVVAVANFHQVVAFQPAFVGVSVVSPYVPTIALQASYATAAVACPCPAPAVAAAAPAAVPADPAPAPAVVTQVVPQAYTAPAIVAVNPFASFYAYNHVAIQRVAVVRVKQVAVVAVRNVRVKVVAARQGLFQRIKANVNARRDARAVRQLTK